MSSDLRKYCSPIRNQLECGYCACFGTIATWETQYRLEKNDLNNPIDLSERDLGTCSGTTCSGGNTMPPVLNQAMKGVCTESCCPYDAKDHACGAGRCSDWHKTGKKIASWKIISNKNEMKRLLDSRQPLVGVMKVHQSFLNFVSGVYHSLGVSDPVIGGHCISIVGYSDTEQCWIGRNSWGTKWGMQGYFKIAYGDSEIDFLMYQLTLTDNPPAPSPEPPPTPSPCKYGNKLAKTANFFLWMIHRRGRFYYYDPPE